MSLSSDVFQIMTKLIITTVTRELLAEQRSIVVTNECEAHLYGEKWIMISLNSNKEYAKKTVRSYWKNIDNYVPHTQY